MTVKWVTQSAYARTGNLWLCKHNLEHSRDHVTVPAGSIVGDGAGGFLEWAFSQENAEKNRFASGDKVRQILIGVGAIVPWDGHPDGPDAEPDAPFVDPVAPLPSVPARTDDHYEIGVDMGVEDGDFTVETEIPAKPKTKRKSKTKTEKIED